MSGLTSKLEAVNKVLAVAGDEPVNSLDTEYNQVSIVNDLIDAVSRTIQGKGWWFNEEPSVTLIRNTDNEINLPENALNASFVGDGGSLQARGSKVYNRVARSYIFDASVVADLILCLQWDELPQTARDYVIASARYAYNQDYFNDDNLVKALAREMGLTELEMRRCNIENRDLNVFKEQGISNIAYSNRRR